MARDFRISAWKHLDEGDLPQASGKAWGLVAETVKAVSAQHGGIIHSHGAIWTTVRELARVAGNAGDTDTQDWLSSSFIVARGLHSNFYEDEPSWMMCAAVCVSASCSPSGCWRCSARPSRRAGCRLDCLPAIPIFMPGGCC